VTFDDAPGLRPTPARVRETLFNWLQYDIIGSRCLDLFAGSGALGFEAASRGADCVVQIEQNPSAVSRLRQSISALSASQITLVQADALQFLEGVPTPFDLVFLDPPFGQQLIQPVCQTLTGNGWLKAGAKIYIESETPIDSATLPVGWQFLKNKSAGDVCYALFSTG